MGRRAIEHFQWPHLTIARGVSIIHLGLKNKLRLSFLALREVGLDLFQLLIDVSKSTLDLVDERGLNMLEYGVE